MALSNRLRKWPLHRWYKHTWRLNRSSLRHTEKRPRDLYASFLTWVLLRAVRPSPFLQRRNSIRNCSTWSSSQALYTWARRLSIAKLWIITQRYSSAPKKIEANIAELHATETLGGRWWPLWTVSSSSLPPWTIWMRPRLSMTSFKSSKKVFIAFGPTSITRCWTCWASPCLVPSSNSVNCETKLGVLW